MIDPKFKSLTQLIDAFPDEQSCIDYLTLSRWNGKVVSPFDETSTVYTCPNNIYRCRNTGKYFNVKTSTLFHNTHLDLRKWFIAIYFVTVSKGGISSIALSKLVGTTQKTAWFLLQRVRNCFGVDDEGQLKGTIEADESFVGGKNKNRHTDKKVQYSQGRSFKDKTPVLGLLQRECDGEPKKVILVVIPSTAKKHIQPIVGKHVKKGATFYSDEWAAYRGLSQRYNHQWIDHSKKQYADGNIHTNTIEGFWSILKRGIIGVYHKTTRKHLQLYCDEFAFRYNCNNLTIQQTFDKFMHNIEHPLSYKQCTIA